MSDTLQETPPTAARLTTLRGNCMGVAVLLIIQFGLGIGINLYIAVPENKAFLPAVFSSAVLATHAIVALVLLAAAISALVRAIRLRMPGAAVFTSIGLGAIFVAAFAGISFVGGDSNAASLTMALATAVAMFSYLAAVFSLR
jgi:hypothetical protein